MFLIRSSLGLKGEHYDLLFLITEAEIYLICRTILNDQIGVNYDTTGRSPFGDCR